MNVNRKSFLGYRIVDADASNCVSDIHAHILARSSPAWLCCINPHSYSVAKGDSHFQSALKAADWLVPDGTGIVVGAHLVGAQIRERITGHDIFDGVMRVLNETGGSVFFLGSSDATLLEISSRVSREYPIVHLSGTYSPPYKPALSPDETEIIVKLINQAAPDVLWVGMTAPKQEKWIFDNISSLNVAFAGAIGAVFDYYAGTVTRPNKIFRQLGLEWLPRLVAEPRRLWRRTFVSLPIFLVDALMARCGMVSTRTAK